MTSLKLVGTRTGAFTVACGLVTLVGMLATVVTPSRVLAQSGAPAPGWVQIPGGGWLPPGHPLAGGAGPLGLAASPGGCGPHTLRGLYIFAASGYNVVVGGIAQPKAIVEAIRFNGDGTLTVPAVTVSVNGDINQPPPGVGAYTVDANCTGTVTFIPGPSFDIFLAPQGEAAWMIQTNPNTVFQGTATRVSR